MLSNRLTTSHQGAELLPQLPEPAEAVTSTRPVEEHKKHMEKWEQNHKVLPRGKQPRAHPAGEQQCREVELLVGTKLTIASSVPRGQQHTEPNSRCGRDPEGTAQPGLPSAGGGGSLRSPGQGHRDGGGKGAALL